MFLSHSAIITQLVYEFLHFKELALAPGKPAELSSGTLLGYSSDEDLCLAIEFIINRLKNKLTIDHEDVQKRFDDLFAFFVDYKKGVAYAGNPFLEYSDKESSQAHPCAWSVFAPLISDPKCDELSFETKEDFVGYIKEPKIGFSFNKHCALDKTGLYIAVKTNNHEMVDAFLSPEFVAYQLKRDDLKTLLQLTHEPKTRLALLMHCDELINWIKEDDFLQEKSIACFDELLELWSFLDPEKQREFITATKIQLWLNLLDKDLGKEKIKSLLGGNFAFLQEKLQAVKSLTKIEELCQILTYLDTKQQFESLGRINASDTLLNVEIQAHQWDKLLHSLGYIRKNKKVTTLRYYVPEPVSAAHNQLIEALVALPIEASKILSTLAIIEAYVHDTSAKGVYKKHCEDLARHVVDREYQNSSFIVRWFNKLLRFLRIKSKSPLHPYIDKLIQAVGDKSLHVIPGELIQILPAVDDYGVYKEALSAYHEGNIKDFWAKIPKDLRKMMIEDINRFKALVAFVSKPEDKLADLFSAFDTDTLTYFNTPDGLHQLIIDTPSFNTTVHLPQFIQALTDSDMVFLKDSSHIAYLIQHADDTVFNAVHAHLPYQVDDEDDFREIILLNLSKELKKEEFERFLRAYLKKPADFSEFMQALNETDNKFARTCWTLVPDAVWSRWYEEIEHAAAWSDTLARIEITDRLNFFEKLISDKKLSVDEFCTFLDGKSEAFFNSLWEKIPGVQWASWLNESLVVKSLPKDTSSLLGTMKYTLRIAFFKAMSTMTPEELSSLCITEDETINTYFSEEVHRLMSESHSVDEAKAKLAALKDRKQLEFNQHVDDLSKALSQLNAQLDKIKETNIQAHNRWRTYTLSFFKTAPYYQAKDELHKTSEPVGRLYKTISTHPLYSLAQHKGQFNVLDDALRQMKGHMESFHNDRANMPSDFAPVLATIKSLYNKSRLMKPKPSVIIVEEEKHSHASLEMKSL